MLPRRGPIVGWSDSRTGEDRLTLYGTPVPSNALKIKIPAKVEEPVEFINSHSVGKQAKKPARKAVSAPNAKAQVTGEDKAAKVKAIKAKVAKTKPVKEVKAKLVKEPKVKVVKEATAKPPKPKPVKEPRPETVKEKHVKKELMEPKIVKEPKAKKAVGTTRRRNQIMIAGQPKWSISGTHVKLERQAESEMLSDRERSCNAILRPRVWCSSKEELVSALPELAKCTNGVSWIQSEPPILFLEDGNMGITVLDVGKDGSHSLELKMTRSFVCAPVDLVTPSSSPPLMPTFCHYFVSPSFQPVDVKTHFSFNSRPKFISAPLPPQPPQHQPLTTPAAVQHVPPHSSTPAPSHPTPRADIQPESEYKHHGYYPLPTIQLVSVPRPLLPRLVAQPYLSVDRYEVPISSTFVSSLRSPSAFDDASTNDSNFHRRSAPASSAPLPDGGNPRRCTCAMRGNIYCGVCDVKLESEMDYQCRTKEPSLRFVPADYLVQMGNNHAHAVNDEVLMASNIFASQLLPASDLHSVQVAARDTTGPSSTSTRDQPRCPCYMYKGMSCPMCSPIPSTRVLPRSEPKVGPNPGQTPASVVVEKNTSVQDKDRSKLLRIRIPRRGASSRAADSQAVQVLPSSSSNDMKVKVEDSAPAALLFMPPQPLDPPQRQPNLIEIPEQVQNPIDQRIPSHLPPEVQVIIDAYISGTPLNIVASKSMLKSRWDVSVSEECAYAYMGFFVVAEVLEERVIPPPTLGESSSDRSVGQVEWRIKCIWAASGEEDADLASGSSSPLPWWDPIPPPTPTFAISLFHPRRNPLDALTRKRNRTHGHYHDHDNDAYPDNSTTRYRMARRQHPNARFGLGTGARLGDRYWSVLPEHARGQLGTENGWDQGFGYEGLPSGWWCERCGRVNYQALLRMRWCVSERCLAEARGAANTQPHPLGSAVPLDVLRDPMQVMPASHPTDTYPGAGSVHGSVSTWEDGMQTFSYVVREVGEGIDQASTNMGAPASASASASTSSFNTLHPQAHTDPGTITNPSSFASAANSIPSASTGPSVAVTVKHVFTGNMQSLQARPTELLIEMQKNVPLRRAVGDSGPYFSYSVSSRVDNGAAAVVSWDHAPACITRAKESLMFYTRGYGEDRGFEMNRLDAFAWVTSGVKKGTSALKCQKRPVVLMCLGSETVISVVPKSGFREPDPIPTPGAGAGGGSSVVLGITINTDSLIPMDVDTDMDGQDGDGDGDILMAGLEPEADLDAALGDGELVVPVEPAPAAGTGKGKGKGKGKASAPAARKPKPRKQDVTVTLLHGDMMILVGDDFEYSIKRTGTSILLIGSYVEGTDPKSMPVPPLPRGRITKSRGQAKAG